MRRVPTSIHARTAPLHPPTPHHPPHPPASRASRARSGARRAGRTRRAPCRSPRRGTAANLLKHAEPSSTSALLVLQLLHAPRLAATRPEHHARRAAAGRGAYFAFGAHPPRLGRARGPGAEAARLGGRPLLSRSLWLTAREARAEPGAARHSGFLGTGSPPRRGVDI